MNGAKKFHKANGPAFFPGEIWQGSGKFPVTIASVRKFGTDKWDYEVTYTDDRCILMTKDAWNFQIRYQHIADNVI